MQRMWAPWRMQYINGVDKPGACFLCEAAADESHDRDRLVVARLERCFCVLNRFPYNSGHLLVAPAAHKAALDELDAEEVAQMHALVCRALEALGRTMKPHGFNVGLNLGRSAGAGLPGHLHWHIVPRWDGDTNFMPVLADVKIIPQRLEETCDLLRQSLSSGGGEPR